MSGLIAWRRVPWSRCGPLLVAAGLAWYASDLSGCLNIEPLSHRCLRLEPVAWFVEQATWLWLAVLGHAIVTYPDGRAKTTLERTAGVMAGYLLALTIPAGGEPIVAFVAVQLAALPTVRWWLAGRGEPRFEVAPSVAVGAGMAVVLIGVAAGLSYMLDLGYALAAITLVAGLGEIAGRRTAISPDRAVELGGSLGAALRDPGMRVWFRGPDDAWVDSTGLRGQARVGYLLKQRVFHPAVLVDALRRVAEGEVVLDPTIVTGLMNRKRRVDPLAALSPREREVLALAGEGFSNRGIAERLDITERTVEAHMTQVFGKLGLVESADQHRRVLAVLRLLQT